MLMTVISYVTKPPFTHIGLKPKQFEYREQLYYKFLQVDSELKLLKRINIWDPRYKQIWSKMNLLYIFIVYSVK